VLNDFYSGDRGAPRLSAISGIISGPDFNALDDGEQAAIRKTFDMERKAAQAIKDHQEAKYKAELRERQSEFYASVTPEMLSNMSDKGLRAWLPKVGEPFYRKMLQDRNQYQANIQALDKAKADAKVVTDVAAQAGWGKSDLKNPAKFGRLLQSVTEAVQNEGVETKKPVPQERVRDIATGMLRDIVIDDGALWDTKAKAYTMFNRNAQSYTIPGASSEEVGHTVSVLRQYGNKNPSLDDVVEGLKRLRRKGK
jgi:hypothetical protein